MNAAVALRCKAPTQWVWSSLYANTPKSGSTSSTALELATLPLLQCIFRKARKARCSSNELPLLSTLLGVPAACCRKSRSHTQRTEAGACSYESSAGSLSEPLAAEEV